MSIIDRYIGRTFLLYFAAGLIVFVTLFLAVDVLSFALRFADVSPATWVRYYSFYLPTIVYQMTPVACLLATVFTISTLNKSNELVALYSVGMGLKRVSLPILVLVGLISFFTFFLSDQLLPRLSQRKNYVEYVEIKKRPGLYSTVNMNKIWYRSENVLFNIKTLNAQASRAQGITLYYFNSDWNLIQLITAKDVLINGTDWELRDGNVTLFDEQSSFPLTESFDSKRVAMTEDVSGIQATANSSEIMSLNELNKFIRRNKDAGLETLRYEVDFYAKFSFASAALVMSLLGVPFSVRRQRAGGHIVGMGICLLLAFGYWTLYSSSLALGQHGAIPPIIAAWAPNLLMLIGSFVMLLRLRQ